VIIFGICFATVLTLVVVPVMYSLFEGMRYYIISAFRGPRWKEAPAGQAFFFSRRSYARIGIFLIAIAQLMVLISGLTALAPGFIDRIATVTLQAPSLLKLAIEAGVFYIGITLEAGAVLALLLLPTWIGLVFFMAKRSREGYFVDITPKGVSVGTPVDRFFIKKDAIAGIKTAPWFPVIPSLCIYSGRRRIVLRKLITADRIPEQRSLRTWLKGKAPDRIEIRNSMLQLKQSLESLLK